MRLCAVVCTYNRPHLLPRILRCFEAQDYPDRYMVILDDGQQLAPQSGDRWEIQSAAKRYPSLGAKRDALARIVRGRADALLPIDDDDLFLPHHLSAAAAALEYADWSRPSVVLAPVHGQPLGVFQANQTGHRKDPTRERLYHPAWAFRLDAFRRAGGYPEGMSGPEDQGLMRRLEAMGATQADPIEIGFPPSYVYCWGHGNISGMLNTNDRTGQQAWARLSEAKPQPCELGRWDPPFDLHHPTILPGVLPRPF